jgi:transposase
MKVTFLKKDGKKEVINRVEVGAIATAIKDKMPAPEERNAFKETVGENLHAWYGHVKKSKSPGMKTFMRTIKEREGDLLNYYETFVTNASAESLNSGIKGFRAELHGISNLPLVGYPTF